MIREKEAVLKIMFLIIIKTTAESAQMNLQRWIMLSYLWGFRFVFDQYSSFLSRADTVYEDMKQRYGSQGCYLLKINTRTFSAEDVDQIPDPWSQYLHKNNLHNQVNTVASSPCNDWP